MPTARPDAMTSITDGSYVPEAILERSKKPKILLGSTILLTARPTAKRAPDIAAPADFRDRLVTTLKSAKLTGKIPTTTATTGFEVLGGAKSAYKNMVRDCTASRENSVAVAIPTPMKVQTAAKLRRLSLDSPQIPCPQVQPLPSLVPNPIKKPVTIWPTADSWRAL